MGKNGTAFGKCSHYIFEDSVDNDLTVRGKLKTIHNESMT